jgi:hypothetical protein
MNAKQLIKWFEGAPFKARHGDVVIVADEAIEPGKQIQRGVVADGEATGHQHRVSRAKVHSIVGDMIQRAIVVSRLSAPIDHEEHKANPIPKGKHRASIQRQYSPLGWARVID